ncbi:TetR/AcrR family transcriptional regulator [Mycobacterium spongiae]|nr:TetR family transcriptional regulator [Mycobacterium spongiae]
MTEKLTSTRTALLRVAEQLIAVGGVAGPSDREIIAAANVGNKSAIRYHFGSRRGLVDAILADHGEVLEVRRALAFAELTVDRATTDLFRLSRVVVEPYASFLADGPSQWAYLAVAQSVMEDPHEQLDDLAARFKDPLILGLVDLMLAQIALPSELAAERVLVGISQVIASIGARARQQLVGAGRRPLTRIDIFSTNLVDMLHGSMTAPAAAATLRAIGSGAASEVGA